MSKILLTLLSVLLSINLSYASENKDKKDIKKQEQVKEMDMKNMDHKNMTEKENTQTSNKK